MSLNSFFQDYKVAIIENDPIHLSYLHSSLADLGCQIAWTAMDVDEAETNLSKDLPDIVFTDLRLSKSEEHLEALLLVREWTKKKPQITFILYSGSPVIDDIVLETINMGCSYIIKEDMRKREKETIIGALLAASNNSVVLSREVAKSIDGIIRNIQAPQALTPRELEVLKLASQDYGNREIANYLYIAEATVKTHLSNIFEKLGVSNRREASTWYRERMEGRETQED